MSDKLQTNEGWFHSLLHEARPSPPLPPRFQESVWRRIQRVERPTESTVPLSAAAEAPGPCCASVLPTADASPSEAAIQEERSQAVRSAVQALPGDLREAIILCEWQDLPVAEAANVLGTTPKAVESRLYRARNLLREQLKKWL